MKMNIIVITVLVVLCFGYFASGRNIKEGEGFMGNPLGRYIMMSMGETTSVYILDSQEGNLWIAGRGKDHTTIQGIYSPIYVGQMRLP